MPLIEVAALRHRYVLGSADALEALRGISLQIEAGEYVAVVGPNGSGKSTLALHLAGLLRPSEGSVVIDGLDTRTAKNLPDVHRRVAIVFQRPEDQIVALTVEEDTAFGPENLLLPRGEIRRRVTSSLERVGLAGFEVRSPHSLSAGQKQRLAIAGALALRPAVIVFDEATAMLDPAGRRAVVTLMEELNRSGTTIVHITHRMEEAARAKRVVVLDKGRVILDGAPEEVFSTSSQIVELLGRPPALELALRLEERAGYELGRPLAFETLAERLIVTVSGRRNGRRVSREAQPREEAATGVDEQAIIRIIDVSHSYPAEAMPGSAGGRVADIASLRAVSLSVKAGETVALIGATGSGKSTLLQHVNGLLFPQAGRVEFDGVPLEADERSLPAIRRRVGLVFQRPEEQLFAQYVGDEIAYGPRLAGLTGKSLSRRVAEVMELVGLPFAEYRDRLTFALSGGEQRKVGLAGVLALKPDVLLLDEPTAGLDPASRRDILTMLRRLRSEGTTIILATHDMDEAASIADRIVVLAEGRVRLAGTPAAVFGRPEELRAIGLDLPEQLAFLNRLAVGGFAVEAAFPLTPEVTEAALCEALRGESDAVPGGER